MATTYDCYALAIVIEAGVNDIIRFTDGVGTADATLAPGTHYVYGDGTEANDLGKIVGDALTAASSIMNGDTLTCAYTGKVTAGGVTGSCVIQSDDAFTIVGTSENTTFDLGILGLVDGADHVAGGGANVDSTLSPSHTWTSDQPPVLIDLASVDGQITQHVSPQGQRSTFAVADPVEMRALEFAHVCNDRSWTPTTDPTRGFQAFWELARLGDPIRLYRAVATSGSLAAMAAADLVGTYTLSDPLTSWSADRDSRNPTYRWEIELAEYFA